MLSMTHVDTLSPHRSKQHVINKIDVQKKNGQDSISNAYISLTTKISRLLSESHLRTNVHSTLILTRDLDAWVEGSPLVQVEWLDV